MSGDTLRPEWQWPPPAYSQSPSPFFKRDAKKRKEKRLLWRRWDTLESLRTNHSKIRVQDLRFLRREASVKRVCAAAAAAALCSVTINYLFYFFFCEYTLFLSTSKLRSRLAGASFFFKFQAQLVLIWCLGLCTNNFSRKNPRLEREKEDDEYLRRNSENKSQAFTHDELNKLIWF